MNIVSIVSYDKNSGSGHLGRTIELSEFIKKKIKKSRSTFITNSRDAKYKLSKKKIKHINLDFEREKQILKKLKQIKPHIIILDTYILTTNIKKKIYKKFKNILVIDDDFKKKHFCNFYLNYNFLDKENIKHLKSKIRAKKFLIGYSFFPTNIITPRFKKKNKVLIFFGSTDQFNIMEKTLKIISDRKFRNFQFNIIIGKYFRINRNKYPNKNFKFLNTLEKSDFKKLLANTKYAIGAGGVSLMERILYKITNLVVITANNQTFGANLLKQKKIIKYVGKADKIKFLKYKSEINRFFFDKKNNEEINKKLKKIKFNNGLRKIYNQIKL